MRTTEPQTATYWNKRPITDAHRDWNYNKKTWVEDYSASIVHPHRKLIIEALKQFKPLAEIGEVGCNAGPNLGLIRKHYKKPRLWGIDASPDAADFAVQKYKGKNMVITKGDFLKIPWEPKSMDVVIADAVLMYADRPNVEKALEQLVRVAKKGIILVEREARFSRLTGTVWAHPFVKLLRGMGLKVKAKKLRKKDWPESFNWQKYGHVIVAKL